MMNTDTVRVAIIFDNFGPYHLARLAAASRHCELLAIETCGSSREYAWCRPTGAPVLAEETLFGGGEGSAVSVSALRLRLEAVLSRYGPRVVFVPGWSSPTAICALEWCLRSAVPAIVMSDSQEIDSRRGWISECLKSRIVGLFSGALVGGQPHTDYVVSLGMPADQVLQGYDVVDNDHFSAGVAAARTSELRRQESLRDETGYFLVVSRFVEKKNLPFILEAYADYRQRPPAVAATESNGRRPIGMILLGDGPLRPELERLRARLGLDQAVRMPGFVQYDALPNYFAYARALIHASTVEQWGLVVNEAMASGLPVLVSSACGCAADLVVNGVTGYRFDARDRGELVRRMVEITVDPLRAEAMGNAGYRRIQQWGVERFAAALVEAAIRAIAVGPRTLRVSDALLLKMVAER